MWCILLTSCEIIWYCDIITPMWYTLAFDNTPTGARMEAGEFVSLASYLEWQQRLRNKLRYFLTKKIALFFVTVCITSLVQVMAWCFLGTKPLSEPMLWWLVSIAVRCVCWVVRAPWWLALRQLVPPHGSKQDAVDALAQFMARHPTAHSPLTQEYSQGDYSTLYLYSLLGNCNQGYRSWVVIAEGVRYY